MTDYVKLLHEIMEREYVPRIREMLAEHEAWRSANPEAAEWLDNFARKWNER